MYIYIKKLYKHDCILLWQFENKHKNLTFISANDSMLFSLKLPVATGVVYRRLSFSCSERNKKYGFLEHLWGFRPEKANFLQE